VSDQSQQPHDALDERFRRALDSILDLVVVERAIRDEDGQIVDFVIEWMNNAPVDVAGRPREELIGRRISELYPVLAGGELIAGYRRVVETGEPLVVDVMPYEDVIDGRPVSGFYTVQASKFEDGVLVASRDITTLESSRRELELTLRELEAAQRLAQMGTWRLDLRTGDLTVSRELRRMYGGSPDEESTHALTAMTPMIHRDDRRVARVAFERAIATGEPNVVEHRVVHRDGSTGHVRSYVQPVVEDGEVVGAWGTTQDISERVADRDALDAEHVRRVTAEAVAEFAATLSGAAGRQDVADAVHEAMRPTGDVSFVALGLLEDAEPVLSSYFAGPAITNDLVARYRRLPLSVDTPMTRVIATGTPVALADRSAQHDEFPAVVPDAGAEKTQALLVVPILRASGTVLGAIGIGWSHARTLDGPVVDMAHEIATITARTVERLELVDLERSVAQTLQLGLLALDVHTTDALVRARYQAAEASMAIGGDWYDAVDRDDGRLAVAVGDVVGRGLPAATTMGQLRAALGVASLQAGNAADAVRILDRYARHVPGAMCATVAFALLDPARRELSYVTAGHPPPVLVGPDGEITFLDRAVSWPLGIESEERRAAAATAELAPGSLLLLYTDGLIERRHEPIDDGLARLRETVARCWSLPLRRVKNAIFGALVDDGANDDIALVAVRTVGAGERLFADAFRARATELRPARRRLRAWLEERGFPADVCDEVLLAVGEAVANAIEHGSTHPDDVVRVEGAFDGDALIVSVTDSGRWQPGIEGYFSGRGRGHLLMRALTADVDVDSDQHGTIVTLRFTRERQYA
jgi:PAS domain S-box-containing protein